MSNNGKDFEQLVECITNCMHSHAIITPNDKIRDKLTGRKRQIDISIRIKDGPTNFLVIVEARDRSRKVCVEYIEQIKSKRDSVGADKAIIVSNKGFTKPALSKAKAYNIETYSLTEAFRNDWSQIFAIFQGVTVYSYDSSLTISFLDNELKILNPHQTVSNEIKQLGSSAKIIFAEDGSEKLSISELIQPLFKLPNIKEMVDSDWDKKHPVSVMFNVPESEKMYFLNEKEELIPLSKFVVEGQVWKKIKTYKPTIKQYKDEKTGEVIAEVVSSDDPELKFEMIAEYPMRTDIERKIFLRKK